MNLSRDSFSPSYKPYHYNSEYGNVTLIFRITGEGRTRYASIIQATTTTNPSRETSHLYLVQKGKVRLDMPALFNAIISQS